MSHPPDIGASLRVRELFDRGGHAIVGCLVARLLVQVGCLLEIRARCLLVPKFGICLAARFVGTRLIWLKPQRPMRSGAIELLVGVVRDPNFGQVLAVGLGGIFVELFKDASLRVLPISRSEVYAMLEELQGTALLQGARGSKPADMDALVDAIARVAQVAQALGDSLESLEINPLRVDGDQSLPPPMPGRAFS